MISDGVISSYNHRCGTVLFDLRMAFRSSWIERVIMDERVELNKRKKTKASILTFLICSGEMHFGKEVCIFFEFYSKNAEQSKVHRN